MSDDPVHGGPADGDPDSGPGTDDDAVAVTMPMPAAEPAARLTPPRAASEDALIELNALLGQGTRYAGKLWFEGRVRIEGRFEGDVRGGVLVIGAGADLEGTIEVDVCIVTGGRVQANIRARDAIELHAPAVVVGDLHAPNVFIDRGVQFEGSCKMAPLGDEAEGGDAGRADPAPFEATQPRDEPPRKASPLPEAPAAKASVPHTEAAASPTPQGDGD